jgi:peptidoglycan-associated lipoprotein
MALGERRAKMVMNYLKSLGIAPERMKIESHGKEQPLDPRHNEDAWARNRRVEFEFFIVENAPGQLEK